MKMLSSARGHLTRAGNRSDIFLATSFEILGAFPDNLSENCVSKRFLGAFWRHLAYKARIFAVLKSTL